MTTDESTTIPTDASGDATNASSASMQGYVPVPVATLIVNSVLPFQLFTRIGESFVLYRENGSVFDTGRRKNLSRQGIGLLFLRTNEEYLYNEYLQDNILRLVQSDDPDCPEALDRFYGASNMVAKQFLADPSSEACGRTARTVVGASIERLDQATSVLTYVNKLMSEIPDLYTHSLHVSLYGLALARAMGISDQEELGDLGIGLMLHDVGKTKLDVTQLETEDPLTDEQWGIVHTHPTLGLECVGGNKMVGDIARDVILNHHERLDGSGYPNSVTELSQFAQIAGIVNHFDRRTTATPYRKATPGVQVIKQMIVHGREQFDAKMLAALVRLMAN